LTLTWALALLGGVVLLALALHGWWSSRRAAPRQAAAPMPTPASRIEPAMAAAGGGGPAEASDTLPMGELRAPAARRASARLDALIDAIVPLTLDAPVSGEGVLAHLPPGRRAGTKPIHIEGLDVETQEWEPPAAGRRYSELQAGVQLANRSGALNEIEYSEFLQKVNAFADAVGATAEVPDMLEVVARARELDGLANPLDAQLTVKLRSNSVAWSVPYVQQVAGRLGFVPGTVPGRLVLPAAEEGAPPVLVLSVDAQAALADQPQDSAVRECALTLDVPQTAAAAEPFPAWHRAATTLADDMDATIVDNEGQPLVLAAFAAIGRELDELYRQLDTLDLAAGSPAARRLFS
jgi:hypothetical protein